jgi:hypothetical protein
MEQTGFLMDNRHAENLKRSITQSENKGLTLPQHATAETWY